MNQAKDYERLLEVVAGHGPLAIAFSGGADSSLLLRAAIDVYGPATPAFFAISELQAPTDIDNVRRVAERLGGDLRLVEVFPLEMPAFVRNPVDRCYHCKKMVYTIFGDLIAGQRMALADGSNLDDLGADRPGHRAIEELGVRRPLAEAGLDKDGIRRLGRDLGVPSWDRLSASCLATRVPTGLEITASRLEAICRYETFLVSAGFPGCRARLSDERSDGVRIELREGDIARILESGTRDLIRKGFLSMGVAELSLDLRGR